MQRLPILNPNKNGVKVIPDSKEGLLTLLFLPEGLWCDENEEICGRLDYCQTMVYWFGEIHRTRKREETACSAAHD